MQGRKATAAVLLATALTAGLPTSATSADDRPGDALGDRLGDRIAEYLCYPPSAERLAIGPGERVRLLSAPPVSGFYRDIQGSDARAWFEFLSDGSARCRVPATTTMRLFFCGSVTIGDGSLFRDTMILCELP